MYMRVNSKTIKLLKFSSLSLVLSVSSAALLTYLRKREVIMTEL